MIKLNILNMDDFLDTVNACKGAVYLLRPDGGKTDINGGKTVQEDLQKQFCRNKNFLRLHLEILEPKDYMSIVMHYIGFC